MRFDGHELQITPEDASLLGLRAVRSYRLNEIDLLSKVASRALSVAVRKDIEEFDRHRTLADSALAPDAPEVAFHTFKDSSQASATEKLIPLMAIIEECSDGA